MAIIGIHGYVSSGKDTVGMMIQRLSNKDWKIKKWAGKVKEMASMLTGVPVEMFEDQEFKKSYLGPEWDYYVVEELYKGVRYPNGGHKYLTYEEAKEKADRESKVYSNHGVEYIVARKSMTVRQFLQQLGTDACRDGLHPNVWVNALMSEYMSDTVAVGTNEFDVMDEDVTPNWLVTDTRFPNEAEAIKAKGGVVIKVVRPGVEPANYHASEIALDDYGFDYVIHNDGNINDLEQKVKEFLGSECFASL